MNKNNLLEKHVKSQISNYLKNHDSMNMEIDVGKIFTTNKVFNTKISKTMYNIILNHFLTENKFKYKKNLSHYIYTQNNIRLYVDNNNEKSMLKCMSTKNLSANIISTNQNSFDLKIKFLKRKPISLDLFTSSMDYDTVILRDTVSLNFGNMYYLNFSECTDKSSKYYQIKILMSKTIKTKKINIVKSLFETIKKIIQLQGVDLNEINEMYNIEAVY